MESIGEKLRLARERNALTLDQVARETHVAKRFLKALEDEDFSVFPGETYAMGFLRNYAEYLGLDAEELIARLPQPEDPGAAAADERAAGRAGAGPAARCSSSSSPPSCSSWPAACTSSPRAVSHPAPETAAGGPPRAGDETGVRVPGRGAHEVVHARVTSSPFRWATGRWTDRGRLHRRHAHPESARAGPIELGLGKERFIDLDGDSRPDVKVVWNDVDRDSRREAGEPRASRVSAGPQPKPCRRPAGPATGPGDIPAAVASPPVRASAVQDDRPVDGRGRHAVQARLHVQERLPLPLPRSTRARARTASSRRARRSTSTPESRSRSGCRTPVPRVCGRAAATSSWGSSERSPPGGSPGARTPPRAAMSSRSRPSTEAAAPFHVESLGCAKNQVDSELMIAALERGGLDLRRGRRGRRGAHRQHLRLHLRGQERVHRDRARAARALPREEDRTWSAASPSATATSSRRSMPEIDGFLGNRDPAGVSAGIVALVGERPRRPGRRRPAPAAAAGPRARAPALLPRQRLPEGGRGMRQPLHLLRHPPDPRRPREPPARGGRGRGARPRSRPGRSASWS